MNSSQWTLEHPEVLLLYVLLIPLVYICYLWKQRGGKLNFAFTNWDGQGFSNPFTLQGFMYVFGQLCSWVGMIFLILALAGPSRVSREKVFTSRGIDIMFVIDISPSMAAQDLEGISRLESAQQTILRFIERRKNDPIGLAVFGSQVALRVPLTLDYSHVCQAVRQLKVMELGEGTALGMGIALGSLHLQNSTAQEKIMILLTDGESNAGEIQPEAAARLAAEASVRSYVIGIGSSREVLVEFVDPRSGRPYRATYKGKLQEDLLRSFAIQTGGEYYAVTNLGGLEGVLMAIDGIERVENRLRIEVNKQPVYRNLIIAAFVLIFADLIIRKLILREIL